MLYNLLDYRNEYIENISTKKEIASRLLTVIDVSINEKIELRENLYLSEDGKVYNILKTLRRKYMTSIINVIDEMNESVNR